MQRGRWGASAYPILVLGRNMVSPSSSPWDGELQGTLTGGRVREDGGSECRSVIDRIGAGMIAPLRKQADFRLVVHHERA
jgi:hypothetical protein